MDIACDWADPPILLLSTPAAADGYGAAVLPVRQYSRFQSLFGWDAQLAAFVAAAASANLRCFVLPAPELFSSAESFARLHQRLGGRPVQQRLLHARFGPVRDIRLLQTAWNFAVTAEDHRSPPVSLGRHPFGSGTRVPAALRHLLVYAAEQRRPSLISGAEVAHTVLPGTFTFADLVPAVPGLATATAPTGRQAPGLQVQSFAEFSSCADSGPWRPACSFPPFPPSADLHRLLLTGSNDRPGDPGLVMLPWNLAYAGSIVPDLMVKLATASRRGGLPCRIALFPFNLDSGGIARLRELILRCREAAGGASWIEHRCFVARCVDPADATALAPLFPLAWIDGNDPEHGWTMRRLGAIGIRPLLLEVHGALAHPADAVGAIAADEPLALTVRDRFGQQIYHAGTLSARRLAELVALTEAHPVRPEHATIAARPELCAADNVAAFLAPLGLMPLSETA